MLGIGLTKSRLRSIGKCQGFGSWAARNPPPVSDFSGTPTNTDTSTHVVFTDLSTHSPTAWLWEKFDGNIGIGWVPFSSTPTQQNPTELFAEGVWSIRLTATNAGGHQTVTKNNYIFVSIINGA